MYFANCKIVIYNFFTIVGLNIILCSELSKLNLSNMKHLLQSKFLKKFLLSIITLSGVTFSMYAQDDVEYEVFPPSGSTVKQLSEFSLTFPGRDYLDPAYMQVEVNGNNSQTPPYQFTYSVDGDRVTVTFANELAPGDYEIYLPEWSVILDEWWEYGSPDIYIHYTVDPDGGNNVSFVTKPASDTEIASLSEIVITFVADAVTAENFSATLTDGTGVNNSANITATTSGNVATVKFNPAITALGEVAVDIQANSFVVDGIAYDQPISLNYDIVGIKVGDTFNYNYLVYKVSSTDPK